MEPKTKTTKDNAAGTSDELATWSVELANRIFVSVVMAYDSALEVYAAPFHVPLEADRAIREGALIAHRDAHMRVRDIARAAFTIARLSLGSGVNKQVQSRTYAFVDWFAAEAAARAFFHKEVACKFNSVFAAAPDPESLRKMLPQSLGVINHYTDARSHKDHQPDHYTLGILEEVLGDTCRLLGGLEQAKHASVVRFARGILEWNGVEPEHGRRTDPPKIVWSDLLAMYNDYSGLDGRKRVLDLYVFLLAVEKVGFSDELYKKMLAAGQIPRFCDAATKFAGVELVEAGPRGVARAAFEALGHDNAKFTTPERSKKYRETQRLARQAPGAPGADGCQRSKRSRETKRRS